ncbi:MAG TPA: Crp/Fnr family transcriptional regulator [Deltaproteobacteria bacterium]|nr:Crp/Fnr family transcriptional regulator [Deltaproteobacteria bacterium]
MNSSEGKTDTGLSCEFQENLNLLRETYFFTGFPLEALKVFAYLCKREVFKEGEYLFSTGDDDGQAFFVISGKTRLYFGNDDQEYAVRDYDEGAFLGGLSLIGQMRRLFSLQAVTETTCLILTREKFTRAMEQFQDQVPRIFKTLIDRILQWEERFLADFDTGCEACRKKVGVSII